MIEGLTHAQVAKLLKHCKENGKLFADHKQIATLRSGLKIEARSVYGVCYMSREIVDTHISAKNWTLILKDWNFHRSEPVQKNGVALLVNGRPVESILVGDRAKFERDMIYCTLCGDFAKTTDA